MPTHTIIDPGAVMVVSVHTSITDEAVVGFWWHIYLTLGADWRVQCVEWLFDVWVRSS